MKRLILSAFLTGFLLLAGSNLAAQNAAPDSKPVKAALKQDKEPGSATPSLRFQAANTQTEVIPIIPGEYKPAGSKAAPPAVPMPEPRPNPPAPSPNKEVKKTGTVKQQQQ